MSKSIWHKLPRQSEEDRLIVVKSKRTGEYLVGNEFEFILDNFTKWAYFDDLLALETENKDLSDKIRKLETELERTRKALDVAQKAMLEIHYQAPSIKVADKILTEALKEIKTALEQKDVK